MSETSARCVELSQEHTDSKESAEKYYVSPHHIDPMDDPFSESDDELSDEDEDEDYDDEDDEDPYWSTDELGIDPEDLYDAANDI